MTNMKKTSVIIAVLWIATAFPVTATCSPQADFIEAARAQIGQTIFYDASYQVIGYPGGDIPVDRGVCTDVVIRAMRSALDLDLQKLVHEDMKENFSSYPQNWNLKSPDRNIDHRRVLNLQTFFKRRGWSLRVSDRAGDYKAGDIVTCIVPPRRPHVMIVSDKKNGDGRPLIIHNIGAGVQEEDRLFEFNLTGHYRIAEFERPRSADSP